MRGLIGGLVGVVLVVVAANARGAPEYSIATGHYYEMISLPNPITWSEAKVAAENSTYLGAHGYLATITSEAENTFVTGQLMGTSINTIAAGGYQPQGSPEPGGNWRWVTGEPWVYSNWRSGEPSNSGGVENILEVNSAACMWNGKWNDQRDGLNSYNNYVVEYPAAPPAQTRQTLPTIQPGQKGLICLVHGFASYPSVWANGMKSDIEAKLSSANESADWTVLSLDWTDVSNNFPPSTASSLGIYVGQGIGTAIKDAGYNNVHFIAHSAGAWVATAAIQQIEHLNPSIRTQCTLLDAYTGVTGSNYLGSGADFAEQYVSTTDLPFTNSALPRTYNFDITGVAAIDGDANTNPGHSWPYQWYGQTVKNYDPSSGTGWDLGYGYGYKLAMEMNGGALPNITDPILGGIKVLPPGTNPDQPSIPTARHDAIVDFQNLAVAQSDTGTKTVNGTQLGMTTGSPVWMISLLTVTDPVNFITFQTDFTSQEGAEGLLGVYWAGQLIGMIDERYALDGTQDFAFALPGTSDPGTYELSFRLDPYTETPSSVLIDNVATGFVVPEPSTLALLSAGVIGLLGFAWRQRHIEMRGLIFSLGSFQAVAFASIVLTNLAPVFAQGGTGTCSVNGTGRSQSSYMVDMTDPSSFIELHSGLPQYECQTSTFDLQLGGNADVQLTTYGGGEDGQYGYNNNPGLGLFSLHAKYDAYAHASVNYGKLHIETSVNASGDTNGSTTPYYLTNDFSESARASVIWRDSYQLVGSGTLPYPTLLFNVKGEGIINCTGPNCLSSYQLDLNGQLITPTVLGLTGHVGFTETFGSSSHGGSIELGISGDSDAILGTAASLFGDTVWIDSVTFPDGTTPESNGFDLVFASGMQSPNIATPEPSTFALLGIGAVSVIGYGWRRRAKQPWSGEGEVRVEKGSGKGNILASHPYCAIPHKSV